MNKKEARSLIRYITKLESFTQNRYDTSKYYSKTTSKAFIELLAISNGE